RPCGGSSLDQVGASGLIVRVAAADQRGHNAVTTRSRGGTRWRRDDRPSYFARAYCTGQS
ncbi:MAG: hypothetical protein O2822_05700, partial [Chloroflexi bacterium]|nr:hypothetical protein [Chloroflexota bacterium]